MTDFTAFLLGVGAGAVAAAALLWYGLTRYLTRK